MRLWLSRTASKCSRRSPCPAASFRPILEALEDRCLPSTMMGQANTVSASQANVNAIASLSHDQIHMLQDQSQQQVAIASFTLAVEQFVFAVVQQIAPQAPQFRPLLTILTSAIPAQ